jgi:hypothetical protein
VSSTRSLGLECTVKVSQQDGATDGLKHLNPLVESDSCSWRPSCKGRIIGQAVTDAVRGGKT